MAGFDTISSLLSMVKPSLKTCFLGGVAGKDTVADVPSDISSMNALVDDVIARAGPCILGVVFGGVLGGDGGTSV